MPASPPFPDRRTLLAGLGAALAGGCAGRRDTGGLRFWGISYEGDYAPHLTAAFTRATGLPVAVQSLPWTAAHEKLLTAFAGEALPDVLMLPGGWVGEFAMIGAVAPVRDAALLAPAFAGARAEARWSGAEYGVPWSVAPQMQFFRRDLLADAGYEAPPTDWQGWRAMGMALKRQRPGEYAMLLLLNWWDVLFTFLAQTGAAPLRDGDTRGSFRTPETREALAFYVSLFADGLAPRVLSTEVQDPLAAFAQGFFAVYPSGPTLLLDLHRRAAEIPPGLWATQRMPGPRGPAPAPIGSVVLCVSTQTRHPEAAWALVRHLTSIASDLWLQRLIGKLPARADAWADPQLATPILAPFAAQVRDTVAGPTIAEWERIRIEVQLIAERVVRGQMTVDEGLAAMDARADQILARRRSLLAGGRA